MSSERKGGTSEQTKNSEIRPRSTAEKNALMWKVECGTSSLVKEKRIAARIDRRRRSGPDEQPNGTRTMHTFCECTHKKTRHRMQYGDPNQGACFDCRCVGMKPKSYVLFLGERRVLGRIAETSEIGIDVLTELLTDANDPAAAATDRILFNLYAAGLAEFVPKGYAVSATDAGRQYLKENPTRG